MKYKYRNYKMPDKTVLNIGVEQILCPEAYFNTSMVNLEGESLQHIISKTLSELDSTVRPEVGKFTLLSGGSSQFKNFSKRVKHEVFKINEAYWRLLNIVESEDKSQTCTWIGAYTYASISESLKRMITKDQYLEQGPHRIHVS